MPASADPSDVERPKLDSLPRTFCAPQTAVIKSYDIAIINSLIPSLISVTLSPCAFSIDVKIEFNFPLLTFTKPLLTSAPTAALSSPVPEPNPQSIPDKVMSFKESIASARSPDRPYLTVPGSISKVPTSESSAVIKTLAESFISIKLAR